MSFIDSYRKLCNRRGTDWWSIVFGYPMARALLVFLSGARWITPTRITVAGFVVKVAAIALLADSCPQGIWITVVLLQVAQVLDSMDGTLARFRGQTSALGAYLDKVLDAVALLALCLAVGWRGSRETSDPTLLLFSASAGGAFVVGCYALWITRSLAPTPVESTVRNESQIFREWLRGWPQVWRFQEADLYFWIALGLVLAEWRILAIGLFATQVAKALLVIFHYARRL